MTCKVQLVSVRSVQGRQSQCCCCRWSRMFPPKLLARAMGHGWSTCCVPHLLGLQKSVTRTRHKSRGRCVPSAGQLAASKCRRQCCRQMPIPGCPSQAASRCDLAICHVRATALFRCNISPPLYTAAYRFLYVCHTSAAWLLPDVPACKYLSKFAGIGSSKLLCLVRIAVCPPQAYAVWLFKLSPIRSSVMSECCKCCCPTCRRSSITGPSSSPLPVNPAIAGIASSKFLVEVASIRLTASAAAPAGASRSRAPAPRRRPRSPAARTPPAGSPRGRCPARCLRHRSANHDIKYLPGAGIWTSNHSCTASKLAACGSVHHGGKTGS